MQGLEQMRRSGPAFCRDCDEAHRVAGPRVESIAIQKRSQMTERCARSWGLTLEQIKDMHRHVEEAKLTLLGDEPRV